ncbi:unnamed protein product [Thelazia callipaeda]|uniref:Uncharacterized protein n=1 Tax=Thelazia callipaeda TaxID=103827 RepID=A0A0N5CU12_THECL|nr:unnamed protein product [Thelazia callipaeda]
MPNIPLWLTLFILLLVTTNVSITVSISNYSPKSNDSSRKFTFPQKVSLFTAVHFHTSQASFLRIRYLNQSICSLNIMGNATIPCKCFAFPSDQYELLIDNKLITKFAVISSQEFWNVPKDPIPCKSLQIDFNHNYFCTELNLTVRLQFSLEINSKKENDLKFTNELEVPYKKSITFSCYHFCLPGIYRIALINGDSIIQVSKTLRIAPTEKISILLSRPHIFPHCLDYLKIMWTNLSCAIPNLEFKMRIFAVPEGFNFEQSYYVEEYDIDLSQQALELPCYQFDIIYAQFCFQIVSIQKATARFNEWSLKCAYAENCK